MLLLQGVLGILLPFMAAGFSLPPLPFIGKPGLSGCGMFEEFRGCGPPCPPTCDTLRETICCEVACIVGCFCADGYILEKDPTTGPRKCIPLNQCPSPGVLSFERPISSVLEGSGKAIITVVRLNGSYSAISCRYRVSDPTGPYAGLVGELEFPDGVVSRTIEIPIQDDGVRGPDFTVRLELFEPSRKTDIVAGICILTILDDDMTPGYLDLEKTQFFVPENVGSARVQVLRHEGSDGQLRVKYRTVPNSASSNVDFSPTTGELIFEEGETSKTVAVSIVDDEVRETPEKFKIELFDFTHGPGVLNFRKRGSVFSADVTIVDNDMRPGILQLERPSYTVYENAGKVDVSVVRLDGQDGQIKVKFETRPKGARAGHDFETQMGELVFEEGELRKTIRIKIMDDKVRETEESFELILFDAQPGPGTINFRGLEPSRRTTTITITDDDMNPGMLQLQKSTYEVMEDVGSVPVDVIRTGGQDGRITVQYQTKGLTANENQDFVPTSGEIIFEEGETRKSIVVHIKDDTEKEPLETLEVQLLNAIPGPGIVHFRGFEHVERAVIEIKDNDMTPGVPVLEKDTYEVTESMGVVQIGVVRLGGMDGQIKVHYQTVPKTATAGQDFESVSGVLVFEAGETRKTITIRIINDDIREPSKDFEIHLTDAKAGVGVINFKGLVLTPVTAVITITDDDMRPGSFMFETPSYEFPEAVGIARIGVVRVGGRDGQIRVKYQTVPKSARVNQDFVPIEGELVFEEGQTRKDIAIQIIDDDVREPTKGFDLQLLDPTAGLGVINFRRFTSNPTVMVSILDDDMKPGILKLEKPSYEVYESSETVTVGVVRLDGTDGEIRVKYKTIAKTAQVNKDFVYFEGELVFGEGVNRKDITVKIIDNDIREPTKTFEVQLLEAIPGLGVINFRRFTSNPTAVISILDDDMRPGTFQIEKASYDFNENVGTIRIGVIRLDGTDGEMRVKYKTIPKTAQIHQDFIPVDGELVFVEKETRKDIVIQIVNDDVREAMETFEVQLLDITPGFGVINFRRFTSNPTAIVSIRDDDMRPGTFQIENASYDINENAGTIRIGVIRLDGTDGEMRVKYKTIPKTAQVHQDFVPVDGELVFGEKETRKDIFIQIVDDDVREATKTFQVQLLDITPGFGVINFRRFTSNPTAIVSIRDNDMKPGTFQFEKPSYDIDENAGTIKIGVIRLDGTDGEMRVKYKTIPKTAQVHQDFVSVDGELVFGEKETRKDIFIKILNDDVREATETFEVQLLDITPGFGVINFRRFTSNPTAIVSIRDDDMRPGTFQFEQSSYDINENVGTFTIGVIRLDGTDGEIRVKYRTIPKTAQVHQDFVSVDGELVFREKETRKDIVVQIVDDDVREATKTFEVQLLDITPGFGVINFRRFTSNPTAIVSIRDDDMRPGIMQLERHSYEVPENFGTLKVSVVRLDGRDGVISVKYKTVASTAVPNQDFVHAEGELVFGEGESKKDITIQIIDDDVREPTKTFEVQLVDPRPGPGVINFKDLGPIRTAVVTITDNDMKPGMVQLEEEIYQFFENVGTVQIPVLRVGGSDGQIRVFYQTAPKTALPGTDFEFISGELVFKEGETRKFIEIRIVNDNVREETKSFEVALTNPESTQDVFNFRGFGRIKKAEVYILDDDISPGFFDMEQSSYVVPENAGEVQISVIRLGGKDGQIMVKYRTVARSAAAQTDFLPEEGEVVFEEGEDRKFIVIQILNDNVREPDEMFEVQLFDPTAEKGMINFRGTGSKPMTVVTIQDDDITPGILELDRPTYFVNENSVSVQVIVVRRGGTDGQIRCLYQSRPKSATAGTDFQPVQGELVFEDGETSKVITVQILDDRIRESRESFEIVLTESNQGQERFVGQTHTTEVIISDDDMTPGILELDKPTYFADENAGQVQVVVVRRGGTDGQIRCQYQSKPKSATAGTDFQPVQGELVFEDGETSKVITVQILDDRIREPRESFEIVLTDPNPGQERFVGQTHTTEVIISDDDMTPGFLELEQTSYLVSESAGTLTVVVRRVDGSDGQIKVGYVTSPKTAQPGFDFTPITGELVFEDGETRKTITIQITDDNLKEQTENFEIQLVDPGTGLNLRNSGQKQKALVTITDDDWTLGIFGFEQVSYTVVENAGSLSVGVTRLGGSDGQVRVRYQTVEKTAQPSTDFQPLSGELVFDDGETKKTIVVPILNDGVREPTETFEIRLVDATPPQGFVNFRGLDQKRTAVVTIFDDDGHPGFLELEEPTYVVSEGIRTLQVVVNRRGGSDGRIQCRYQTTARSALAGIDFEPGSGELIFEDGETEKTISIQIVNDKVKESIKSFEVQLLDPLPAPGIFNFRVVGSKMRTLITIADDDTKPGLVQMELPFFTVKESVGTFHIPVIRVNGSDGQIKVQYHTAPRTAQEGTDFTPLSGHLVFEDGESRKDIQVQIQNDRTKEPSETFEVRLTDASPGPGVLNFGGLGFIQNAVITILDDDMNHGFLELESPSYHFSEGSGTASIGVIRLEGTDGRMHVRYQTVPKTAIPGTDYIDTSGELVFEDGMRRKDITIQILNDHRKEATKTFEVQLFEPTIEGEDVTFRALGSRSISLVSIWDDDQLRGTLKLDKVDVVVPEDVGSTILTIIRNGGSEGPLHGRFFTVDGSAHAGSDFESINGSIEFKNGEMSQTISVPIKDDALKENMENFMVELLVENDPSLRSISFVNIIDNDNNPGVFQFRESQASVREGSARVLLTIIRTDGTDGSVSMRLRAVDGSARLGEDYTLRSSVISFSDGEREKSLDIDIIDDNIREGTEHFKIGLFDPTNGAILGQNSIFAVTILDDDGFAGRPSIPVSQGTQIFFTESSVTIPRGTSVAKFKIRREGDWIPLKVLVETLDGTARAGIDYKKTVGEVQFKPNEIELTVTLNLIADPNRVGVRSFQVRISHPSSGIVVKGKDLLTIFIEGSERSPSESKISFHQQVGTSVSSSGRRAGSINPADLSPGGSSASILLPPIKVGLQGQGPPSSGLTLTGSLSSGLLLPNLPSAGTSGQSSLPALPPPQGQRRMPPQGQQDCAHGLIFNPCFFGCPQVCNLVADPICNKGCTPTCVCPRGLILESLHSSKCVPLSQCPRGGASGSGRGILGGGGGGSLLGGGGASLHGGGGASLHGGGGASLHGGGGASLHGGGGASLHGGGGASLHGGGGASLHGGGGASLHGGGGASLHGGGGASLHGGGGASLHGGGGASLHGGGGASLHGGGGASLHGGGGASLHGGGGASLHGGGGASLHGGGGGGMASSGGGANVRATVSVNAGGNAGGTAGASAGGSGSTGLLSGILFG